MIRITQSRQNQAALAAVTAARARLQAAQQTAMSGERVTKPSDDPASAARARLLGELAARSSSYQTTTSYGLSRLQTAESALSNAGSILTRAREIATSMANGTMSASERTAAATEVEQLRRAMIDTINTRHGDEYVFADVASGSAPYTDAVGFNYDVNTYASVRRAEVGPSQTAEIGASAAVAFGQRTADPSSVDVVAQLDDLANDLRTNNIDGVRADIDGVTTAFEQVLAERTRVGVRTEQLRRADEAASSSVSVATSLKSDLIDADAAEAFSSLTLAQNSMQAAVTVAARMLGPSLLDAL